jgi:hypothetical protein
MNQNVLVNAVDYARGTKTVCGKKATIRGALEARRIVEEMLLTHHIAMIYVHSGRSAGGASVSS